MGFRKEESGNVVRWVKYRADGKPVQQSPLYGLFKAARLRTIAVATLFKQHHPVKRSLFQRCSGKALFVPAFSDPYRKALWEERCNRTILLQPGKDWEDVERDGSYPL